MPSSPSTKQSLSSISTSHSTNSKGKSKQTLLGNPNSSSTSTNPTDSTSRESDSDRDETFQDAPEISMASDSEDLLIGRAIQNQSSSSNQASAMDVDSTSTPSFPALNSNSHNSSNANSKITKGQVRKIPIPPHRMTPLKNEWPKIYTPLVEMAKLQVRMNVQKKAVEIRVSQQSQETEMERRGKQSFESQKKVAEDLEGLDSPTELIRFDSMRFSNCSYVEKEMLPKVSIRDLGQQASRSKLPALLTRTAMPFCDLLLDVSLVLGLTGILIIFL